MSDELVKRMEKTSSVKGFHVSCGLRKTCDACFFGKQAASPHPSRKTTRSCLPGERFHSDVCFAATKSLGGNTCFVTLKDESTGFRDVTFLKSKAGVAQAIECMIEKAEKQTGRRCLSVRSDCGKEYVGQEVQRVLMKRGITHETSVPYVKQGNGIAERENRTLCNTARALLFNADLTTAERKQLWAEAIATAVYLRNRIPNKRTGNVTPHELWFEEKPDVSHLRIFGSPAFVKIPECKRKQFDSKSRKTIFIGYDDKTCKVVRVYDREKRTIDRVSDAQVIDTDSECTGVFVPDPDVVDRESGTRSEEGVELELEDEHQDCYGSGVHEKHDHDNEQHERSGSDQRREKSGERENMNKNKEREEESDPEMDEIFHDAPVDRVPARGPPVAPPKTGSPPGVKSKVPAPQHKMVTRNKGKDLAKVAMACAMDPVSVDDALGRQDGDLWKEAMDEEMRSLIMNETWDLVSRPRGKNLVSSKWVLKSKVKPDGVLEKRKARLVARGFSQTHGVDYFETFSPVARYESVRCMLALAAAWDMNIMQFDVKTAFLNGNLDEEVYMEQPEGYEDGTDRVCKLKRSLYGLKQSPRNWNSRFNIFLEREGFHATPEDTCVFVKNDKKNKLFVCLYVDDGLVCGTDQKQVSMFLTKLKKEFEVTISQPNHYVGMELSRDRKKREIRITQKGYISRVLERFGLSDCKPVLTPMDQNIKLEIDDSKDVFTCPYREAIGCLNYLSLVSRPDITFAVNKLARFCNNPKQVHWAAVKRVMRYLKGNTGLQSQVHGSGGTSRVKRCLRLGLGRRRGSASIHVRIRVLALQWTCDMVLTSPESDCAISY